MTLEKLVRALDQYGHGLTIYAADPWQPSSTALVTRPREDDRILDEAVAAGCRYFLEVHIALGVLHQVPTVRGREANEAERRPRCGKLWRVDREQCEHCSAVFAPPKRNGTEIFEAAEVSRGRGQDDQGRNLSMKVR